MNIVLGDDAVKDLAGKYIVLSLDCFSVQGSEPVRSYCVVEHMPMAELVEAQHWQELHERLIDNFAKQNWNFCEQAIEHLMGRWGGEVDSFYVDMADRVKSLRDQILPADWSPVIHR